VNIELEEEEGEVQEEEAGAAVNEDLCVTALRSRVGRRAGHGAVQLRGWLRLMNKRLNAPAGVYKEFVQN